MEQRVTIERQGHIAKVTLSRPDKMNALDVAMLNGIVEAAREVEADASIRVVVLSGEGRGFCAGIDLSSFSDPNGALSQPLIERSHGITNIFQEVSWAWRALSVPVIAAVHGVCFGGGLQIMLGSDIKYIAADTKLSVMEMKWGLIPDMAGTQLMRHNIREDIIKELTYTHRIFSGEEAVGYGFATHISEDPMSDAMALAAEIASKSPSAIVKAKKIINKAPYLSAEDGLLMESEEQGAIIKKHNQMEAVYAGMQKRPGEFTDFREE